MSYVEQTLSPGEQLLARARIHWAVVLAGLPVLLAGLGVAAFVFSQSMVFMLHGMDESHLILTFFALGLTGMGLLGLLGGLVYRRTTEIAVTNRRIVFKTGLLWRRTQEQRLSKVESIRVDQGLLGRLFGFGTIYIHGTGSSSTPMQGIERPMGFRAQIQAALEAFEAGQARGGSGA